MLFHHSLLILVKLHHSYVIPSFEAHLDVIPSFLCHFTFLNSFRCYSFIQNPFWYHFIMPISFPWHSIILSSFWCQFIIPTSFHYSKLFFPHSNLNSLSFHHSNVIPSFQAHSEVIISFLCHSFIQNSSRYHSIIEISIQSFLRHSIILKSFLCHSYSFNDRNIVVWNSFIPSSFPAGMTLEWDTSHFGIIPRWNERRVRCVLIPLEWQGWPWNDWTGPGTTEWGGLPEVIQVSIPVILAPSRHSGIIRKYKNNGDDPRMRVEWYQAQGLSWQLSLSQRQI